VIFLVASAAGNVYTQRGLIVVWFLFEQIHILGRDLSQMVEDLGAENLPPEYGGSCTCSAPNSCVPPPPDIAKAIAYVPLVLTAA